MINEAVVASSSMSRSLISSTSWQRLPHSQEKARFDAASRPPGPAAVSGASELSGDTVVQSFWRKKGRRD